MSTDSKYTQLKEAMSLFESLTPGGIEFVNNPKSCYEWIKAIQRNQGLILEYQKKQLKALEDLCNEMLGAFKEIEKRSAFIDDGVNNAGDKQISELWTIANFACIRANSILSSSKTENNDKE